MRAWHDIYNIGWIILFGMMIAASFILVGATAHAARRWTVWTLGAVLALLTANMGPLIVVIPLIAGSWMVGALTKRHRPLFAVVLVIGLAAVAFDALWPTKIPIASELTTNRPTVLRLAISIAQGDQVFRGGTMYSGTEPVVAQRSTLFGKYPIRVGYSSHMDTPIFELQLLLTLVAFAAAFFLLRLPAINQHGGQRNNIQLALIITFVFLMPIHGLIPIVFVLGFLIGRSAHEFAIIAPLLNRASEFRLVLYSMVLISLYHASFASTLIESFGSPRVDWDCFYASTSIIGVAFGSIAARAAETNN